MENYFIIFQYFAMVCCLFFMGVYVLIYYHAILDEFPAKTDGEISFLPALYATLIFTFSAMIVFIQKLFRKEDDCWMKSRALKITLAALTALYYIFLTVYFFMANG